MCTLLENGGCLPLHGLKANIQYGESTINRTAYCAYVVMEYVCACVEEL